MSAKIIVLIIVSIICAGLLGTFLGKLTYENGTWQVDLKIEKDTRIIQEQRQEEEGNSQQITVATESLENDTDSKEDINNNAQRVRPILVISNSTQSIDKELILILNNSTK